MHPGCAFACMWRCRRRLRTAARAQARTARHCSPSSIAPQKPTRANQTPPPGRNPRGPAPGPPQGPPLPGLAPLLRVLRRAVRPPVPLALCLLPSPKVNCPAGTGGLACETCPVGTWSAGGVSAVCTPCDYNLTTAAAGSKSSSACSRKRLGRGPGGSAHRVCCLSRQQRAASCSFRVVARV